MKIKLFKPHSKQRECINRITETDCKYIIIDCGRQFGKSLLAQNLLLKWALETPNSTGFWVSPIYSQAKKVFDELVKALKPTGLLQGTNRSEVWIKLTNGSVIHFKSAEKPDNLRGNTLDFLVMDEAAFMRDETWNEILRPATLVKGKKILFISTPKGKNYFYTLYNRGMSDEFPDYLSLKYTSYDTPFITEDEINEAKNTLPTDIFNQEIMAEFIEDGGEVFRNYSTSQIIQRWIEPNPNERYFAGIDLGRQNDFTVLTIVNNYGQICYVYRERRNNWVNIVLVCQNKTLDIYVNGVIAQSMTLTGVPKQNYGDVFIGLGGGFDGYVSNLWYWDHVLSLSEIQNLFQKGPKTVMVSTQTDLKDTANRGNNYLALQWYTN